MQIKPNLILERSNRFLLFWMAYIPCLMLAIGCATTDPVTGQKVYDPYKTEAVEQAIIPAASSAVRRVINSNPSKREEIAKAFLAAGAVFRRMVTEKKFSPIFLAQALDEVITIRNDTVLDLKNAAVALWAIYYGQRGSAELPEDQWVIHVANVFATGIERGLHDAGL